MSSALRQTDDDDDDGENDPKFMWCKELPGLSGTFLLGCNPLQ